VPQKSLVYNLSLGLIFVLRVSESSQNKDKLQLFPYHQFYNVHLVSMIFFVVVVLKFITLKVALFFCYFVIIGIFHS